MSIGDRTLEYWPDGNLIRIMDITLNGQVEFDTETGALLSVAHMGKGTGEPNNMSDLVDPFLRAAQRVG